MEYLSEYEHNDVISLTVKVCNIFFTGTQYLDYRIQVQAVDFPKVNLQIWEWSPAAEIVWQVGEWYLLQDVLVVHRGDVIGLDANQNTQAEQVAPPSGVANELCCESPKNDSLAKPVLENMPENNFSLIDIPGVDTARAESLREAGHTSVSKVADAQARELATDSKIATDTARCIQLAARELRGDSDTEIVKIADECNVERGDVADIYASMAHQRGTLSKKLSALREKFSDDQSILALDGPSTYFLYSLYAAGYRDIQSVATASVEDLREVPYLTDIAGIIRDTARKAIDHPEKEDLNEDPEGSEDETHICEKCGNEYKYESVLRKHSYSCDEKQSWDISLSVDEPAGFSESALDKLNASDTASPNSTAIVQTLLELWQDLKAELEELAWFQRFVWDEKIKTPYIGPDNPTESPYVWIGLVDEFYEDLPKHSHALQIEFGVNGNSAPGFLGQDTIWGILLGKWASDSVVQTIETNLREHSYVFAQFLAEHDEYVLVTASETFETPTEDQLKTIAGEINRGFALTLDLQLSQLPNSNIYEITYKTLVDLVPFYRLLAGIKDTASVKHPSEERLESGGVRNAARHDWDVESLAAATTLNASQIQSNIDNLVSEGCQRDEAMAYVQRYLKEMLRGEGLFAVSGVGPSCGYKLSKADITTIEKLQAIDPQEISKRTDLSAERIQRLRDAAESGDLRSLDPDDEEVANRVLKSEINPPVDSTIDNQEAENAGDTDTGIKDQHDETETQASSDRTKEASDIPVDKWLETCEIPPPDELPLPDAAVTTGGGVDVHPNYLTEYYEAFRNARKVLQLVFEMDGVDIEPDNRNDPRVQYFLLLDACIGFTDLSAPFTGYGQQHRDRLSFRVDDYYEAFGNGQIITDYQIGSVHSFTEETQELLQQKVNIPWVTEYVRPCVPGTNMPLPELPGSFPELQGAIQLLNRFPAYPPLQTETGASDQTIPIADIYQTYFSDLDAEYQVDLTPFKTTDNSVLTGPVTEATPTSNKEAKSKLLDYGRLSHLFRRVSPPAKSPLDRTLGVFALDWYRPKSPNFNALQALAKHGEQAPVESFQPRLRDLIYRRFLLDDWQYDYITVFPGHKTGSLSSQLVTLAKDGVLETDILYTPLLERTETVERQRNKTESERQEIAIDPSASLRSRSQLNGETIILFDDICTTGSSLIAGSYLLQQAGAGRVVCLTLGLTPGGQQARVAELSDPEAVVSEVIAGGGR